MSRSVGSVIVSFFLFFLTLFCKVSFHFLMCHVPVHLFAFALPCLSLRLVTNHPGCAWEGAGGGGGVVLGGWGLQEGVC